MRNALRSFAGVCLGLVVLTAASSSAFAKGVTKYSGMHPLPPHSGQFCYLEVPHIHAKAPSDMRVYRTLPDGVNVFVGDEVALGFDGVKHAYVGPHPLTNPGLPTTEKFYCYIRGPHYHAYPATIGPSYAFVDGVAWYVGEFGPEFERDKFNLWVNDSGVLPDYAPPKVDAPPPNYHRPALADPPVRPAPPNVKPPEAPAPAGKKSAKPATKAEKGTPAK